MSSYIFSSFIISIVFAAIFFYGSADTWGEGFVAAAIFTAGGLESFRNRNDSADAENRRSGFRLLLALALLAVYSFVQCFATLAYRNNPPTPLGSMFYSFDALAGLWVGVKILALVCFAALLISHFGRRVERLVWGAVGTGAFFALLGVVRFLLQLNSDAGEFPLPALRRGVGFGTFINQNHFALLMLMTLGLIFALALKSDFAKEKRFGLLAVGIFVLTALILTGSRAGILSACISILFLFILPSRASDGESDLHGNFGGRAAIDFEKSFCRCRSVGRAAFVDNLGRSGPSRSPFRETFSANRARRKRI